MDDEKVLKDEITDRPDELPPDEFEKNNSSDWLGKIAIMIVTCVVTCIVLWTAWDMFQFYRYGDPVVRKHLESLHNLPEGLPVEQISKYPHWAIVRTCTPVVDGCYHLVLESWADDGSDYSYVGGFSTRECQSGETVKLVWKNCWRGGTGRGSKTAIWFVVED